MYLAGFIVIPVVLLTVATIMKFYEKESRHEVIPQRNIPAHPQTVTREGIGKTTNY
jgi:hypothetical protein